MRELFLISTAWIFLSACQSAQAADVTELLRSKTALPKTLSDNCDKLAAGNEKSCRLKQADFDFRPTLPLSHLSVKLALQSRHVPMSFGGNKVVLYDRTAHVDVSADVSNDDCAISNLRISSTDAIYQLLIGLVGENLRASILRTADGCVF